MSDDPVKIPKASIRLRRTGTRYESDASRMSQPTFYKMRGQGGKKVHMGLLIVIVLVGLVAQFRWMQRMKQGESGDVAPNILLEKFGLWFSGKLGGAGAAATCRA